MTNVTLDDILHVVNIMAQARGVNKTAKEGFNVLIERANLEYLNFRYEQWEETRSESDDLKFLKDVNESEALVAGVWAIPANFYRLSSVSVDTAGTPTYCDVITDMELQERLIDSLTQPSTTYPVCTVDSANIRFYPSTITSADINYIRYPATPVYVDKLDSGIYVYDSASSTEFEWPDSCAPDLIKLMMWYLGIDVDEGVVAEQVNEINR